MSVNYDIFIDLKLFVCRERANEASGARRRAERAGERSEPARGASRCAERSGVSP